MWSQKKSFLCFKNFQLKSMLIILFFGPRIRKPANNKTTSICLSYKDASTVVLGYNEFVITKLNCTWKPD